MNIPTPLRVLVVDDVNTVWDVVIGYFRAVGKELGVTAEVRGAPSVEELEALIEDGETFHVTLVDFGLRDGQPSGLSALEALNRDGAGGHVAIHADMENNDSRLLLAYAAFRWFPETVALIPKTVSVEGATYEERAKKFVRSIIDIHEGRAPEPDRAASLRKPFHDFDDHFGKLFTKSEDFPNFKLMQRFNSFPEAAKAGNWSEGKLRNWGTEVLTRLDPFLRQASENSKATELPVKPILVVEGSKTNRPAQVISRFARSQSLFFDDPAVGRHFNA